jgi:uncharacterized membrane protein
MQSLGAFYIFLGLVLVLVDIPLYFKLIGPNQFYGLKIPKAYQSEKNWYDLNKYCAKQGIMWGSFIVLLGLCCFLPLSDDYWFYVALILPFLAVIPPIITILRYKNQLR